MSPENHPEPDALDDLDSETVEDLDVGADADDVEGGYGPTTTCWVTLFQCVTE